MDNRQWKLKLKVDNPTIEDIAIALHNKVNQLMSLNMSVQYELMALQKYIKANVIDYDVELGATHITAKESSRLTSDSLNTKEENEVKPIPKSEYTTELLQTKSIDFERYHELMTIPETDDEPLVSNPGIPCDGQFDIDMSNTVEKQVKRYNDILSNTSKEPFTATDEDTTTSTLIDKFDFKFTGSKSIKPKKKD